MYRHYNRVYFLFIIMEQNIAAFNDHFKSIRAQEKYIALIERSNIYYIVRRRQNFLTYIYNLYTREVVHCGTFTGIPEPALVFECRLFSDLIHIRAILPNEIKINVFMNTTQVPWRNYDMPRMSILWYFNNSPRLIVKNLESINNQIPVIYNYQTHDIQHMHINMPVILCVNPAETHYAYIDTNYAGYIYEINTNNITPINLDLKNLEEDITINYMFWDTDNVIWIGAGIHMIAYDINKKISAHIKMQYEDMSSQLDPMTPVSNRIHTSEDDKINIYMLKNFQMEKLLEITEDLYDDDDDEDDEEDEDEDGYHDYADLTNIWIVGKSVYRYYASHNMIQYNKISSHTTVKYKLLTTRYKLMNRAKDFENYFKPFIDHIKKLHPQDRDILGQHILKHIKTKLDEYNTTHQLQTPSAEYLKKYFDEVKRYYYKLIKKYHPNTRIFFNPSEEKKYNLGVIVEEKRKNDNVQMIAAINKMSTSIHTLVYKRNLQFNKYHERNDEKYKQAYEHLHDTLMRRIPKYIKRLTDLENMPHPTKPTKKLYMQILPLIETTLSDFQRILNQPINIENNRSSSDNSSGGISKSSGGSRGSRGGSRVSPL